MLDIDYIKKNAEKVKKAIKDKNLDNTVSIDHTLDLYNKYVDMLRKVEEARSRRNKLSETISSASATDRQELIAEALSVKNEIKGMEDSLAPLKAEIDGLLTWVPNVPADDVPIGHDETGNVVIRQNGELPSMSFAPKDHVEIATGLGILDLERGAKVGGFRGYFLKNEGAELEQAILKYACDMMRKDGYSMLSVPWIAKPEFFYGTGYFPWGEDDHFRLDEDKALIGTAEVSLTSYYAGEVLDEKELPIKLFGLSPCFRKEVGAYGKDTRGIFRLHYFNKVEQVVLTVADEEETRKWHEKMLGDAEKLLQNLKLPYHVLLMCTGDMGPGQAKKYDVETWFPSQGKYRETHSDSYFRDFQSRRLNIKYRDSKGDLKYVYTLNNTVAATPRLLAAVIENYQNADGSVNVPEVLLPYVSFKKILPK